MSRGDTGEEWVLDRLLLTGTVEGTVRQGTSGTIRLIERKHGFKRGQDGTWPGRPAAWMFEWVQTLRGVAAVD